MDNITFGDGSALFRCPCHARRTALEGQALANSIGAGGASQSKSQLKSRIADHGQRRIFTHRLKPDGCLHGTR